MYMHFNLMEIVLDFVALNPQLKIFFNPIQYVEININPLYVEI